MQNYNFKESEKALRTLWEKKKTFTFVLGKSKKGKKKIFSIDTPPPYPSGKPWHIGAVAHYSQIDMIARTARMQGLDVFFPIGIDRNGLPVEHYTEKKYNVKMSAIPREKFVGLCSVALDELEAEIIEIMKNMGMSCDFEHYYRTDSPSYRALTQSTFIELWKKKLIYEDTRPNNFCPGCRTTIADAEIIYEELPTEIIYIKFKTKPRGEVTIATTRPELLSACQVIMFNPEDNRYKQLEGKKALVPIYNREVSIIPHSSVDSQFGTGVVMMCSYGDYTDVRIFRELGLEEIKAIDEEGKMTEVTGYKGMSVKEARKKIIEELEKKGLVEKRENIMHRTPICERCRTPIEIISMPEFYLKKLDFLPTLKKIAKKIIFHPSVHRQILLNWINSVTLDWPISRRRYYGTEIPIWYCKKCHTEHLPKADYKTYWQPWLQKAPFKKCVKCGCEEFTGEERVFDTWMDSSISPLFVSKFRRDKNFFAATFPCTIRPQGKEIIRTWLFYTLLRCYQLTNKIAFEHVWIMGWGVDEKGEKMSKSKGNVIDPVPILEKYGADAFRFWAASEASLGSDFRCSEQRIAAASKFINKLNNIANFVSQFNQAEKPARLEKLDKLVLNELNKLIRECLLGYKEFNFFIPSNAIRQFLWNIFADHYIELVKARAYSNDKSACYTLHKCLRTSLLLLSPIIPFISYYIYKNIYKKNINSERFPREEKIKTEALTMSELAIINSKIWKAKKEKNLSLKAEIAKAMLPSKFKAFANDLKACHNIKLLEFGDVKTENIRIEL